jgi:hypothetical protein
MRKLRPREMTNSRQHRKIMAEIGTEHSPGLSITPQWTILLSVSQIGNSNGYLLL